VDRQIQEIDRMMRRGYALAERGKAAEAADVWLEAWERIKERLPAGPLSAKASRSSSPLQSMQ